MNTPTNDRILGEAQAHRDSLLNLSRQLVEIETPSDRPDCFDPAFELIQHELNERGLSCQYIPGRDTGGHLYARPRSRQRNKSRQLILGHVDTVWDVGTLQDTPFEIQDNERATGPGLFDMKGGLAMLMVALDIVRDLEMEMPLTPVILINSDEEIGSPESTKYIRCLSRMVERCYVLEPAMGTDGDLKTARKGVGHFTVTISGRASHAGISPEQGNSAILELSHVIQTLNELNQPSDGITVNVGVIEGGTRSNVVASESVAEVDVRVRNSRQAKQLKKQIKAIEPSNEAVQLTVEGGFRRPPMEFNDRNQRLWTAVQQQGEALGLELDHTTSGGASDGNTASQATATIDGLGPVGDGAHETYEYVEIPGLINRTALLCRLLTMEPLSSKP